MNVPRFAPESGARLGLAIDSLAEASQKRTAVKASLTLLPLILAMQAQAP
jgi:hypothetical protein